MAAPMIPVGVVAKGVAIKPGLAEIVQTMEVLRCELIVGELALVQRTVVRELVSKRVMSA